MKQWLVCVSLSLPVLLASCATDTDLLGVQADTVALARQQSAQHQTADARLQQVSEHVGRFNASQEEIRRGVTRLTTTVNDLRVQLQRLQADVQEILRQAQRSAVGGEELSDAQMAEFERRLGELEKQLRASAPAP